MRQATVVKFASLLFASVSLAGCSQEGAQSSLPTAPDPVIASRAPASGSPDPTPAPSQPTPGSSTDLWGFVVDPTGLCVDGATVEVVRGQGLNRSTAQITPCDAWSYGGGFDFTDLAAGVELTLRASAPGYTPAEKSVVPVDSSVPHMAVLIELVRAQ